MLQSRTQSNVCSQVDAGIGYRETELTLQFDCKILRSMMREGLIREGEATLTN